MITFAMGQLTAIVVIIVMGVLAGTNISAFPQADVRGSSLVERLLDPEPDGAPLDRSAIPSSLTKDDLHELIRQVQLELDQLTVAERTGNLEYPMERSMISNGYDKTKAGLVRAKDYVAELLNNAHQKLRKLANRSVREESEQIHNRGNSLGGLSRRRGPPPEDTEKKVVQKFSPNDPLLVKIFKSVKKQVLSYIKREIMHTPNKLRVAHLVASDCYSGTWYEINFVIHQVVRGSSKMVVPEPNKFLCTAIVTKEKKKKVQLRKVNCKNIPPELQSQGAASGGSGSSGSLGGLWTGRKPGESFGAGGADSIGSAGGLSMSSRGSGASRGSVGSDSSGSAGGLWMPRKPGESREPGGSGSAGGLSMGRRGSGASRGSDSSGSDGGLWMHPKPGDSRGSGGSDTTVQPVTLRPLLSPTDPSVQRAFGTVSDNIKKIFVQYRKGSKPDAFQVNRRISAIKRGSADCAVNFNVREEGAKVPWNCLAEIANYEQVFFEIRLTRLECQMGSGNFKRKFVATALGNSFEIKSHLTSFNAQARHF